MAKSHSGSSPSSAKTKTWQGPSLSFCFFPHQGGSKARRFRLLLHRLVQPQWRKVLLLPSWEKKQKLRLGPCQVLVFADEGDPRRRIKQASPISRPVSGLIIEGKSRACSPADGTNLYWVWLATRPVTAFCPGRRMGLFFRRARRPGGTWLRDSARQRHRCL